MPKRSSMKLLPQGVACGGCEITMDPPTIDSSVAAEDFVPLKNPHAAALGRLGGKKGGPARAQKLSAERRSEIARLAAEARWGKATKNELADG